MASRYEVEVTIGSARDLKNVNWRYGDLKAYAVVWVDPSAKCSTKADLDGDTSPVWDEKLTIPIGDRSLDDAVLHIDIVHALSLSSDDQDSDHKVKPLIGSARLPLSQVLDEAGIGGSCTRSLKLKRPSGRPQGKLELKVRVLQKDPPPPRNYDYYAPPYGQPAPGTRDPYGQSRDYPPAPYGQPSAPYGGAAPYAAAPPAGYPYSAPPPQGGYGYGYEAAPPAYGYGAAPPAYGQGGYGASAAPPVSYGQGSYGATAQPVMEEKKKSKYGMGTGLAVGAVAGVLGGLAIEEGLDYVEDKIADDAAEKVEEDLGYNYDDDF